MRRFNSDGDASQYERVWLHIPGEYNVVTARSADATALLRAHQTPISRRDANRLLQNLAVAHGLPSLTVRFGVKRGVGGVKRMRSREVVGTRYSYGPDGSLREKPRYRMRPTGEVLPYVGLPAKSMPLGGHWWDHTTNRSLLRVGLVLHEFAHAKIAHFHRRSGHGPEFVQELDALIAAHNAAGGRS